MGLSQEELPSSFLELLAFIANFAEYLSKMALSTSYASYTDLESFDETRRIYAQTPLTALNGNGSELRTLRHVLQGL